MRNILLAVSCVLFDIVLHAQSTTTLKLWYNQPATQWVEALPIGNGRLGAMVFGNPSKEKIQLNENTVWGGQRIRLYSSLMVEGIVKLVQTKNNNHNPFYDVPHIKKPLISLKAKLKLIKLPNTFLYDIATKTGGEYTLVTN
jgi:hypothetical protein